MAIETALTLAAIAAARPVVTGLISAFGAPDALAAAGGEIVAALLTSSSRQSLTVQRDLAQVNAKLDAVPVREFEQHMAAGRRYLRDLPMAWRTPEDRRELIRDARGEFIQAFAVAERMSDAHRQALADVAVAGCWMWVPSPLDVLNTVRHARLLLEDRILAGAYRLTSSYRDVLVLAKACGEQPARTGRPIVPWSSLAPKHGARIAVRAVSGAWVGCAGVEVGAVPGGLVLQVRNYRAEWVSFCLHGATAIATLPQNRALPTENRVAPGGVAAIVLAPCPGAAPPTTRTIGFILPRLRR
jgi:hypothetical protein